MHIISKSWKDGTCQQKSDYNENENENEKPR